MYGSYFKGNGYVEGALSYGSNHYSNVRILTVGSIQYRPQSSHDGDVFSGYLGAGYYFDVRGWSLGPFAALRYIYLNEDSFTEKGADSLNLAMNSQRTDSFVSDLGVRLARPFKTGEGYLIPELSGAFRYDFGGNDHLITGSFAGAPNAEFAIRGLSTENDGVVAGISLTYLHKSGFSSSLTYSGEFRENYNAQGIMGQLRYVF